VSSIGGGVLAIREVTPKLHRPRPPRGGFIVIVLSLAFFFVLPPPTSISLSLSLSAECRVHGTLAHVCTYVLYIRTSDDTKWSPPAETVMVGDALFPPTLPFPSIRPSSRDSPR